MRWGLGRQKELRDRTRWHRWFAWFPVRMDDGVTVWWEWLEERYVEGAEGPYEYRTLDGEHVSSAYWEPG